VDIGKPFPKVVELGNVVKGEAIMGIYLGDPNVISQRFMQRAFLLFE
jgi:hypothetical protein